MILREKLRAATPLGGIAVFLFVSGKDRVRGGGSAVYVDPWAFAESHRSHFHPHGVSGVVMHCDSELARRIPAIVVPTQVANSLAQKTHLSLSCQRVPSQVPVDAAPKGSYLPTA